MEKEDLLNCKTSELIKLINQYENKYLKRYQSLNKNNYNFFSDLMEEAERRGLCKRKVLIEKYMFNIC